MRLAAFTQAVGPHHFLRRRPRSRACPRPQGGASRLHAPLLCRLSRKPDAEDFFSTCYFLFKQSSARDGLPGASSYSRGHVALSFSFLFGEEDPRAKNREVHFGTGQTSELGLRASPRKKGPQQRARNLTAARAGGHAHLLRQAAAHTVVRAHRARGLQCCCFESPCSSSPPLPPPPPAGQPPRSSHQNTRTTTTPLASGLGCHSPA